MLTRTSIRRLSMAALALAVIGAATVSAAPDAVAPKAATSADLGGPDRFLSYVTTDKPIYRPSEKVLVRAMVLNAATHQPLASDKQAEAQIKILGPKGDTVATGDAQSADSVVGFSWTVPEGMAGGEYTLKVDYPWAGYAPSERKFDVRVYRAPRLKNQIVFLRDGYGAGDKVSATLHTERAEGGIPANAKVTLIARVDDAQVFSAPATVDAAGNCTANFDLPKSMERGEGTLAFVIEDGGVVETASKTIPILLQTLDLQIYPEGGDAVAGVPNRFYLEAKTPAKKPADLVGVIKDSKGAKVADVKTEHEGRGVFGFTPAAGEAYTLTLSEPAGITKTWKVPEAKAEGVVLRSLDTIVQKNQPARLEIESPVEGKYKVTLSRREAPVADAMEVNVQRAAQNAPPGYAHALVSFDLKPDVDGVLTATVWDEKGTPLAERLIYRQPAHEIHVTVTPEKTSYTPGGKAALNILTTDETGKPISATVGLTVTDESVLEMIDKREQAPRLPAMVLLEPEVKELADAHVYLDPANPKSAIATDLLLGTQGWRRFATVNVADFLDKNGDQGRRVLANVKPAPPPAPQMMAFGAAGMGGAGGGRAGGAGGMRAMAVPEAAANGAGVVPGAMALDKKGAGDMQLNGGVAMGGVMKEEQKAKDQMVQHDAQDQAAGQGGQGAGAGGIAAGRGGRAQGGGGAAAARPMVPRRPIQANDPGAFVVVREYAHDLRPGWTPTDRSDFSETLYWNAAIKTDDKGEAKANFAMADAVTAYRIVADSFDKTGALGASTSSVQSVQPFFIEPKLPLEVTAGDVIEMPIAITNHTDMKAFNVTVTGSDNLKFEAEPSNGGPVTVTPDGGSRQLWKITVGDKVGDFDIVVSGGGGDFSDKVTRKLHVVPKGFPTEIAFGGLLDQTNPGKKQFTVPASVVAHSMTGAVAVFPSPVANMTEAVQQLLQEPNGCFEQTSSTNYPLAMAQMYFTTHQGVNPALVAKANDLLAKGYQRLIGFECQNKGYEWFGGTVPGHEALTAYGLMEFSDMKQAKLSVVDDQMVARTRDWMLSRRDGAGGFQRNAKSLDSFGGAPADTTNAYITWALLRSGETPKSMEKEVAAVRTAAAKSDDSYVVALAANVCDLAGDADGAQPFLDKLAKKQSKEGDVAGAATSITRSGGAALAIETTSLATQAWLNSPKYAANAQSGMTYLADSCKGGRFGSTQSTILALQAITAYDVKMAHPRSPGQVTLIIDNKPMGDPVDFTADTKEALKFTDFASSLTPGTHTIALEMKDGSQMPFSMAVKYNSVTPASDSDCKLDLTTTLKDAKITEGGITEERVLVTNKTDEAAASPTAIIGIPGGLEVRHDQLKELVKAGKIDAYEVRGREVILYWRNMKANAKADISISLTAAVPGTYTAPASRVYEYYTDEFKIWKDGTSVTITPK